jgi:hypothetical protein
MRPTTIILGVMVLLTGCSSEVEKDLVRCKASAVKTNREQMSGEKLAAYLRECMRDNGWPLRTACLDKSDKWDTSECYLSHD